MEQNDLLRGMVNGYNSNYKELELELELFSYNQYIHPIEAFVYDNGIFVDG